jgi:hypothetical protein
MGPIHFAAPTERGAESYSTLKTGITRLIMQLLIKEQSLKPKQ